jgi:uncharacterized protein (TIGR03435 family)
MKKPSLDQRLERLGRPSLNEIESVGQRVWEQVSSAAEPGTLTPATRARFGSPLPAAIVLLAAVAVTVFVVVSAQNRWEAAGAFAAMADGSLNRVVAGKEEVLQQGQNLGVSETLRSGEENGGVFTLADGSRVEMRARSEVSLEQAIDGVRLRLNNGSILVNAAKQLSGYLYVQTKDVSVSVIGTVFVVNAEEEGSRVSVIEGEVRVRQGDFETKLRPGEHVSTAPKPEPLALKEEIAWSSKAVEHLALLQQSRPPAPSETPRRQFEEAAIRPCTPEQLRPPDNLPAGARGGGNLRYIEPTTGRFYARCMTVAGLISASYPPLAKPTDPPGSPPSGLPPLVLGKTYYYGEEGKRGSGETLRGAPDWAYVDGYTIEAITDASADGRIMMSEMVPELLERRFQVKVHTEFEQVPALTLEIAPGGLKMKPFQEGDCEREKKENWPRPKPRCNSATGDFNGANVRFEAGYHTLGTLAGLLNWAFDLPVIDKTGNSDRFAIVFEFGPDEASVGILRTCQRMMQSSPDELPPCASRPTAPSIHTALSQLGLKVERTNAPREFRVVDRVERPSPN